MIGHMVAKQKNKEEITMKKFITICLAAIMMTSLLTACGGKSNANVGTYKVESLGGKTVEEYKEATGEDLSDQFQLELKKDGKGSVTVQGEENEITWELDGEKLSLTADGDTLEATLKDGKVTMELGGIEAVLTK